MNSTSESDGATQQAQVVRRSKRVRRRPQKEEFAFDFGTTSLSKEETSSSSTTPASPRSPSPPEEEPPSKKKRGRPSAAATKSTAAKSRTKVTRKTSAPTTKTTTKTLDRIQALAKARNERMKETVMGLSEPKKDDLLKELVDKYPGMIMAVISKYERDDTEPQAPPPPPGPDPEPSADSPEWCVCTNCREMPTMAERQCCEHLPAQCKSRRPEMDLGVLDPTVLEIAQNLRNEMLADFRDEDVNRGYRYAAYRQYILWQYGKLGRGQRRIIPSCVTWRIRDTFPDPNGQYVGFRPGLF